MGRKSRMAGLKATDAQGPSECGRELCRTEFVHDSKVGLSLNILLQIVCRGFGSSMVKAPLAATFGFKDLKRFLLCSRYSGVPDELLHGF